MVNLRDATGWPVWIRVEIIVDGEVVDSIWPPHPYIIPSLNFDWTEEDYWRWYNSRTDVAPTSHVQVAVYWDQRCLEVAEVPAGETVDVLGRRVF